MTLLPCSACGRHVKSAETACPFCGAARTRDEKVARVAPAGRLKAVAVSAAIAASACSSSSSSGPIAQPAYGGVAYPVDGAAKDATDESPAGQPLYGGVEPVDAGTNETG